MPHWRTPYRHVQQDATPLWLLAFLYVMGLVAVTGFAVIAFLLVLASTARGQQPHHHALHPHYQSWVNKDNKGCCNNQHCRPLADADERTARGFLEVRVEGAWCPVEAHHFLKTGNVPDASTAHVCAWRASDHGWEGKGPCERLLCYQPKPGS